MHDGGHRRYESVGHSYHFVAGTDACGQQGKVQRVVAAINSYCVLGTDELGQTMFKITQLLTENQIALTEAISDRVIDLRLKPLIVLAWIYKRNSIFH